MRLKWKAEASDDREAKGVGLCCFLSSLGGVEGWRGDCRVAYITLGRRDGL